MPAPGINTKKTAVRFQGVFSFAALFYTKCGKSQILFILTAETAFLLCLFNNTFILFRNHI